MSVIVIKYGGSLLEDPGHRSAFLKDVAALSKKQKLILVHGGGKEISRQMEESGIKPRFVEGRRYTDDATMAVVQKALAGLNKEIVSELVRFGAKAKGGSGADNHFVEAEPIAGLGRVGIPRRVNATVLEQMQKGETLPVLYSVGEDSKHALININADDFAQAIAVTCRAERLVFLTDKGGVIGPDGKKIDRIDRQSVEDLIDRGIISGGMEVKARASIVACDSGVERVDITDNIKYLLAKAPLPSTNIQGHVSNNTSFTL